MRPHTSNKPAVPIQKSWISPHAGRAAFTSIASATAVLAPLPLGCSGPWARLALEAVLTLLALVWATYVCHSPRTLIYLLGACGLALFQLLPLPDAMLTAVAPVSAGAWKVANAGTSVWGTISIDPAATATGMRRLLLWLAAAASVKDTMNDPGLRRALGVAMAISAALIWMLALAFPVKHKERLVLGFIDMKGPTSHWWKSGESLPVQSDGGGFLAWAPVGNERYRYDEVLVGDGFGPYVSSNQFAGGLCLTLPFLFGGIAIMAHRLGTPIVGYAAIGVLMAAATWTLWERAGSRAGTASLMMAQAVFVAAIAHHVWARRISMLVAAAYGLVLLLLVGGLVGLIPGLDQWFPQPLQAKVAAFLDDPRAVAANVARRMFLASPILGVGINSYAAIYPRFQPGEFTLFYAYNDYTQLLGEAGLVGIAAAIGLATPVFARMRRISVVPSSERPLAAAATAALAGLAAHMAFEWNLHQPANAFLACLAVGLFLAVVPGPKPPATQPRPRNRWVERAAKTAFVAACALALGLLVRDANSDLAVKEFRGALMSARPAPKNSPRPDPQPLLERALARGEEAAAWDPRNATLQLLAGQARLHLAQFESGPSQEASLSVATSAFRRAQRRRAAVLGLPEPLPPPTKNQRR